MGKNNVKKKGTEYRGIRKIKKKERFKGRN